MTDSLYCSASAEILNEEVYPGDCSAFKHHMLGQMIGL